MRELATIEELEKRIIKMEEKMLLQDKAIKTILDLVQRAIETQFKQWKEDQELFKKGSADRLNRIMKELGYKTD